MSLGELKPRRRFRTRVFVSLLTLSLATSAVSGATFYSLQLRFIAKERTQRAATLLTSLATQAELGAYAGDATLCDLAARRTFRESDVVMSGVYDSRGREILRLSTPALGSPAPVPLSRLQPLLHNPDAAPLRVREEGYDDLWAPIVTSARPAAAALSSEPGDGPGRREVVGLARVGLSLQPAREQLDQVLRTGLYLAAFLACLGALAALLIARRISGPILALAAGADAIRDGNLDVRISADTSDEIGLLAASFNAMAAELRETLGKLAALNRDLEGEVTRRTDEIRRSAEFTAVLNAAHEGEEPRRLLDDALGTLRAATGVSEAAILLTREEALEFELHVAARHPGGGVGVGPLPSEAVLATGQPLVEAERAVVPILFRGRPEGAIVLTAPTREAVDFAARAAGQLAIAVSNARAYAALQHLARELTERNAALVQQRDQLREMNRLKSEFLANVSHELRTPLNAILGYTELIAESIYGPVTDEQREALAGVDESSRNLLTLINQILDLSKVEAGKLEIYPSEVAVHDIAQHVVAEAQGLLRRKPLILAVVAPSRIVIKTDAARVQQIVTNLVSNAIKFTDQGAVTIEVTERPGGGCTIAVRDTGIGIAAADQELIFDEFRQADGSPTRRYAGTGLGLAIARQFAHALGGSLTVESELGQGSTFTLTLPAEPPVRPPPPPKRGTMGGGGRPK